MRQLRCRDMGNECNEVISGGDDDEVMQKAAEHLTSSHPEEELGQAALNEIKLLIYDAS